MADNAGGAPKKKLRERVKDLGKAAVARIPLSQRVYNPWRAERLQNLSDSKIQHEEETRVKARLKAEAEARGESQEETATKAKKEDKKKVALGVDAETTQGDYCAVLNDELDHAIVEGHRRLGAESGIASPEALIRTIVCQPQVIKAIREGHVKTPFEHVNDEYAGRNGYEGSMLEKRDDLADQLEEAVRNPNHIVKKLDGHDLDIIYVTLLGNPGMWITGREMDEQNKRIEKHNEDHPEDKRALLEAPKCGFWDPAVPKPNEAFMLFLKQVAKRERAGSEGDFIGNVLKILGTKPSFGGMEGNTFTNLINIEWVNEQIGKEANRAIEAAVAEFSKRAFNVLTTPRNELEAETSMPGLGYARVTEVMLGAKQETLDRCVEVHETAKGELVDADNALNRAAREKKAYESQSKEGTDELAQAKDTLNQANTKMQDLADDVRAGRLAPTPEEAKALVDGIQAEQQVASGMIRTAEDKIAGARRGIAAAEADIASATQTKAFAEAAVKTTGAAAVAASNEFQALVSAREEVMGKVQALAEDFRHDLTKFKDEKGDVESIPEKMANRFVNKEIAKALAEKRISELCSMMEEVTMHFPAEDPEASKLNVVMLLETAATYEKMGNAEMAGMNRAQAKQIEENAKKKLERKGEDLAHEYKKVEFDGKDASGAVKDPAGGKLGAFLAEIESTELPDPVKTRMRTVHTMIASRKHSASDVTGEVARIKKDYAHPMRKAAQVTLDKYVERGFEDPTSISSVQWIIAKQILSAHSKGVKTPPMKTDSAWKIRFQTWGAGVVILNKDNYFYRTGRWLYQNILRSPHRDIADMGSFLTSGWRSAWNPPESTEAKPSWPRRTVRGVGRFFRDGWRGSWGDKSVGRDPRGKPVETWVPRPMTGALMLSIKTWFIYAGIAGALLSASPQGKNPFSYPGYISRPIANYFGFKGWRLDERSYGLPYTWGMGLKEDENVVRVKDDSYDIPEKLADRGEKYYRDNYGLGTVLDGEKDDKQAKARLAWVTKQPEVLRFLQERLITEERSVPARVVSWETLRTGDDYTNPDVCSVRKDPKKDEAPKAQPAASSTPDASKAAEAPKAPEPANTAAMVGPQSAPIPESCKNFGVTSKERVVLYKHGKKQSAIQPEAMKKVERIVSLDTKEKVFASKPFSDINDGATLENRVCCTISIQYAKIPDGRVINVAPGVMDKAVQDLRNDLYTTDAKGKEILTARGQIYVLDKKGQADPDGRVSAAYFQDSAVTYRMVTAGQLINTNQGAMMSKFAFQKVANVDFLISKVSSESVQRFLKMCARGDDPLFIRGREKKEGKDKKDDTMVNTGMRDAFVDAWQAKIKAAIPNIDPSMDDVPEETMKATLDATAAEAVKSGWGVDVTQEFNRINLGKDLARLSLGNEALDILLAQQDILAIIKEYEAKGSDYLLAVPTANEFVTALSMYKNAGGNLNDFSIAGETPGRKVSGAMGKGYVFKVGTNDDLKAIKAMVRENVPEEEKVDPAMQKFYETQADFGKWIEGGVVNKLLSEKTPEARIMNDALEKVYAKDTAKMFDEIKAEIFRVLSSKDEKDMGEVKRWQLTITGDGASMVPKITKYKVTGDRMKFYVSQFVKAKLDAQKK
jgi:hypothetical protein